MKKYTFLFLLLNVIALKVHAQELMIPAQTQYLADNPFLISPSFAGIGDNARVRLNGLAQWVGIKDAPLNQSLAGDFRIADRSGVGVYFYNDKNGNTRQYGAKFSFAQHLILDYNTEQYLSLGLSFNMNHFRIQTENFTSQNDPSVDDNRATDNYNFDIGFLYRYKDFYFSASAVNFLKKDLDKFNAIEPDLLLNYQFYLGTILRTGNKDYELEPSALVQYFSSDGRSTTDLNLKFRYLSFEDYYWMGVTARFLNEQSFNPVTVGPMVGLKKSNFYVAYSYQITTNEIIGYNSGTHMITIGLDFLQNLSNCPCTQNRIVY